MDTMTKRCLCALALFSFALRVPLAHAELPRLNFFTLGPTAEEASQGPGLPPATLMFGFAVAVQGNTALVSMPEASPQRVAVFTRNEAGQWLRTDSIQNEAGSLLALDGRYALAASDTVIAAYRHTAQGWIRTQTIDVPPVPTSLVMDGRTAVYVTTPPGQPGSVHVLYRDHRGRWVQGPTLTNRDGAVWGSSLALSKNTLVVGASSDASGRGAAYILRRIGWSWREQQKLLAPEDDTQSFGAAVAVNGDRIAIGAPATLPINENGGFAIGAAYVFDRKGRFWYETQALQPTPEERADTTSFGSFVGLTRSMLAVVAPAPDRFSSAEVFIYEPNGVRRTYAAKGMVVLNSFAGIMDLAASGNTVLAGVPFDSPFSTGFVAGYENVPTP
ncbi:MAG: hypothetical protein ABW034_22935 [Steroidobacteraceae bacterium]